MFMDSQNVDDEIMADQYPYADQCAIRFLVYPSCIWLHIGQYWLPEIGYRPIMSCMFCGWFYWNEHIWFYRGHYKLLHKSLYPQDMISKIHLKQTTIITIIILAFYHWTIRLKGSNISPTFWDTSYYYLSVHSLVHFPT